MAITALPGHVTDPHFIRFSYTSTVTAYAVGYFWATGEISGMIEELPSADNDYMMLLWAGGSALTNVAGYAQTGGNSAVAIGDILAIYTGDVSILCEYTAADTTKMVAYAQDVVSAAHTGKRIRVWVKGV